VRNRLASAVVVVGALALSSVLPLEVAVAAAGEAADSNPEDGGAEQAPPVDPWRRPPISLRGGYTVDSGQVVLAYRFERVGQDELQDERSHIEPEDLLGTWESAPETVDLDRHVFSALWSPIDQLTFQLELPFVRTVTDEIHRPGGGAVEGFETKSVGFGDVMFWVLYRVYRDAYSDLHLNLGLSFPSGSIAEAQLSALDSAGSELQRLSYPLQLGSGTVDLQPGFTYAGRFGSAGWGFQGLAVLRAGENDGGYILGNTYELTAWGGWAWNDWLSNSFSLAWRQRFDGSGADALIDPATSPMADARLLSGERLDALFGLSITPTGGRLQRTRWVLDAGLPAYQRLDGPQSRTKWLLQFALEIAI